MKVTDEYYFKSHFSGAVCGKITGLTIWYNLICPKCGADNKKSMRLSTNDLIPRTRKDELKCKKCKELNSFSAYFGVKLND